MSQITILPLYIIRKTNSSKWINEKTLLFSLLMFTSLSIFLLLTNMPSNQQVIEFEKQMGKFLVPKYNRSKLLLRDETRRKIQQNENRKEKDKELEPAKEPVVGEEVKEPSKLVPDDSANSSKSVNNQRKEKIKEMTLLAWNGYKKYAWGKNELRPLSKRGHSAGIFGGSGDLGATIVDAMDTLHLMGFHDEFKLGRDWIEKNLHMNINAQMSTFEINIRFVGGLLALHTLTKDKLFLDKAVEVANSFLHVFNTHTGLPMSLFNPVSKSAENYGWAPSRCSILAEIGTISLEFEYLSDLTGNNTYREKAEKINKVLEKAQKPDGLFYNYINPTTGTWCSTQAGLGALADSFYEYLIKLWLYKNKSDDHLLKLYLKTMDGVKSKLIGKADNGLIYAGEYSGNYLQDKMGHLACFTGGMFALTSMYVDTLSKSERDEYTELAKGITNTCHESYIRMPTRIGPEAFSTQNGPNAMDRYYILRPEVIESYFYLWRMTKEEKYRDWAWDAVEAIEKHCRTENGYSGITDVTSDNPPKDDVQQSFFFAETLKYLYLIFSDDDVLPLDKYVFNTEAHPFLIKK